MIRLSVPEACMALACSYLDVCLGTEGEQLEKNCDKFVTEGFLRGLNR